MSSSSCLRPGHRLGHSLGSPSDSRRPLPDLRSGALAHPPRVHGGSSLVPAPAPLGGSLPHPLGPSFQRALSLHAFPGRPLCAFSLQRAPSPLFYPFYPSPSEFLAHLLHTSLSRLSSRSRRAPRRRSNALLCSRDAPGKAWRPPRQVRLHMPFASWPPTPLAPWIEEACASSSPFRSSPPRPSSAQVGAGGRTPPGGLWAPVKSSPY